MTFASMMFVGFVIDVILGWPNMLFARIGHPVTWIGHLITVLENRLNTGSENQRRFAGAICVVTVLVIVTLPAVLIQWTLSDGPIGLILGGILAWPMFAVRSMHDHVRAVAVPLAHGDVASARAAVAMIVGRDPSKLGENGIARASIESLAENTSDGVIAPVFWGVVAGLPGLVAYKAINTMDSMIGHRSDRYEHFGKTAARLDDVVNLPASRLSAVLFAASRPKTIAKSWSVIKNDAHKHRSPNAGWPESAVAGALDIRLSGPRIYEDRIADEPWLNPGAPDPKAPDVHRALSLYRTTMVLTVLALGLLALI
ncbi:MAG: adenosylcobinamide-phosphate synthase CbiB [Paracoccaceae bacterium]